MPSSMLSPYQCRVSSGPDGIRTHDLQRDRLAGTAVSPTDPTGRSERFELSYLDSQPSSVTSLLSTAIQFAQKESNFRLSVIGRLHWPLCYGRIRSLGGQDRTGGLSVPNRARYLCATPRYRLTLLRRAALNASVLPPSNALEASRAAAAQRSLSCPVR